MKNQDTLSRPPSSETAVTAPPRKLLWLIVGLFLLLVIGSVTSVVVFRNVLRPGQQQRVIDQLPFMQAFLPRPASDTVPTAAPVNNGISPEDLLNAPLVNPTNSAPQPAGEVTLEAVGMAATPVPPTATPTPPPTATPLPPTAQPVLAQPPSQLVLAQNNGGSISTAANTSLPPAARMYGFTHVQQTWNNCGPANVTMALSFYGWRESQDVAASYLKPDSEDKNVSPGEMVTFINDQTGVRAVTRIGGDMDLLKAFIAANFPIIIETGYSPEGYDWIGHYQTVVGYDDNQRVFYVYDSFLGTGEAGAGLAESYDSFDAGWQAFNRVFIVLYEREREGLVQQILGDRADLTLAAENALIVAQNEARAQPQNAFAWFNIGTSMVKLERFEEAAVAYDRARQLGLPFRMLWYQFGMFEAYYNAGRYDDVMALVNTNLTNGAQYVEETYYWQGRAYAAQGQTQEAAAAYQRALLRNPRYSAAREALDALNA